MTANGWLQILLFFAAQRAFVEGVTLIGSDMEYILEEALPASCGGSPLDYQIVEEEDEHGFTRLTVRVHPSVAIASEQQVIFKLVC